MIHLKLTIMALLWAGGFIAGKQITHQAGPFTISFLRFFVAAVVFISLAHTQGKDSHITMRQLGMAACAAFLGLFCYNYLFFSGIRYIDAGRGSVIIGTVPIVVAAFSYGLMYEQITLKKILGIILSVVGAWVVISKGNIQIFTEGAIGRGEIHMILCVFCAAMFTLFSKGLLKHIRPVVAMAYISGLGTVFLFLPAVMEIARGQTQIDPGSFLGNLFYLSLGPSVIAVSFYYEAIKIVGPSRASQYMNLIPVFSVILAFIFLGEQFTSSLVIGGGLVTTGLYLNNLTT